MEKRDTLIRGTFILAIAALVARILGIFQRVPLDYMVGNEGNVYFGVANSIYMYLLIIATAGFPSAISKMISERYALGKHVEAKRIYKAALIFAIVSGVILSGLLYIFAPFYATSITKTPGAEISIRAVAPALLLFPVIAIIRGYFQGIQVMYAVGLSQIIEQIMRVIIGISLALIVLNLGWGDRWISAAATFGSVFGSIGAFGVMLLYGYKLKRLEQRTMGEKDVKKNDNTMSENQLSYGPIYREIFSMSLPVVVTAMTVQFLYLIDSSLFMRLTSSFYSSEEIATSAMSSLVYNAQSIAGIPPILAIALSQSIIPILSAANSLRNTSEVERQASLVMRVVIFTGIPAALLLSALAYSVNGFLFSNASGSGLIAALTATTIFQITMMTSNSILLGLGIPRPTMIHTLLGFLVKIMGSLILAPIMGGYGLVFASFLCFLTITILNLLKISNKIKLKIIGKSWTPYLINIAITTLLCFGLDFLIRTFLNNVIPLKMVYLLSGFIAGTVSLALYLILLIRFDLVSETDTKLFPRPIKKVIDFTFEKIKKEKVAKNKA